jgi:hypothetical protein
VILGAQIARHLRARGLVVSKLLAAEVQEEEEEEVVVVAIMEVEYRLVP